MQRKLAALAVGISSYPGAPLKNPANDAKDVTLALDQLGFTVIELIDATNEELDRAITSFRDSLNSNDVGLFYFAGHGMQIDGENYLVTIDTHFTDETTAKYSSFPLNRIIETMDKCSNNTNIIILDACRNNPFVRSWDRGEDQRGLASVYAPRGTLIAYATSPGQTAKDGKGKNGSYTEALLNHIYTPDLQIEDMFKRVRNTLSSITSNKQTSWEHTSLAGDFVFNLSLGLSVDLYANDALADQNFLPGSKSLVTHAIDELKSYNWYRQNDAVSSLTASGIVRADNDSLFVLGRNIYQAAVGGSISAIEYIKEYRQKTRSFPAEKTKAVLDGMLFEVFFNSKGELRKDFKLSQFNELFELKQFPEFSESFEFISEALLPSQNKFYLIPGKSRQISLDVSTTLNANNEQVIDSIIFEGFNVMRNSDEQTAWGSTNSAYPITEDQLRDKISAEMVVPTSQLKINLPSGTDPQKLLYPYGKTIRK